MTPRGNEIPAERRILPSCREFLSFEDHHPRKQILAAVTFSRADKRVAKLPIRDTRRVDGDRSTLPLCSAQCFIIMLRFGEKQWYCIWDLGPKCSTNVSCSAVNNRGRRSLTFLRAPMTAPRRRALRPLADAPRRQANRLRGKAQWASSSIDVPLVFVVSFSCYFFTHASVTHASVTHASGGDPASYIYLYIHIYTP